MEYDNRYEGFTITIINDISFLKLLDHPNVVKIIDAVIGKNVVYMVLPLAQTDLSKHRYKPDDIPLVTYPLVQAMGYYFNKKILHLDIKPANILYFEKENQLKFIDFGISR